MDEFVGELAAAYELLEGGRLDVLGGGRYWYLATELKAFLPAPIGTRKADDSIDWIDPFVGVRSHLPFLDRFHLMLRGDVGGFGVSSDFSYNLGAGVAWELTMCFQLALGWRHLYVDYDDNFVFDVTTSGPLLGFLWRF